MLISISCEADPVVMNSLRFCLFGKVFLSTPFLNDSFTRYSIFEFCLFHSLNMSSHCLLTCEITTEKLLNLLCVLGVGLSCIWQIAFLLLLSKFFVFDFFKNNLIIMYLSVELFKFNLFGIPLASWIWVSISHLIFGKFLFIIYLNMLSVPFSFFSGISIIHTMSRDPSASSLISFFWWWWIWLCLMLKLSIEFFF